ncbi:MAG: acetylglutamate kinase [Actinomycetota bacterium]|nr:acetylglutamate kinase [Actinomycetota bacterium]
MTALADAGAKAEILTEALPYIRRLWGQVIVVKYGGSAMLPGTASSGAASSGTASSGTASSGTASLDSFAGDIVLMRSVGMRPLVVHGGGPQIGELMTRLGKVPEFREGLRVTDAETLDIARMVLVGKVNREVVSAINVHAPLAVGLSGEDAGLITASARDPQLGFVGDVADVNPELLRRLLAEDLIPVVATIGADPDGQAYNINADTAAGAIAESLGASKLVYLSDIDGLRRDRKDSATLISSIDADGLEPLLVDGTVSAGMIPKVRSCVHAVRHGVGHAHILDGRAAHALLLEIFTREGIGTMVSR